MKITFHSTFKKSYKKRIFPNKKLVTQVKERISLFQENRQNSILNDHQLKGKKYQLRSFSITGNIRIIYFLIEDNHALFIDIGTHNQVY